MYKIKLGCLIVKYVESEQDAIKITKRLNKMEPDPELKKYYYQLDIKSDKQKCFI